MANQYRNMGIYDVTFKANVDLSGNQYYMATPASVADYVKLATGDDGPAPIGVIQTDTASNVGDPVTVRMFGPTKAFVIAATSAAGASGIDLGDYLRCNSSGYLCKSTTDGPANARALGFMDSGSGWMDVFFYPIVINTCDVAF